MALSSITPPAARGTNVTPREASNLLYQSVQRACDIFLKSRVMYRERSARVYFSRIIYRFANPHPGSLNRQCEDAYGLLGHRERITGVEKFVCNKVANVMYGRYRLMNDRMVFAKAFDGYPLNLGLLSVFERGTRMPASESIFPTALLVNIFAPGLLQGLSLASRGRHGPDARG